MKMKDWMLGCVEAVAWYGVIYLSFYTIKNDMNLFVNSFTILALIYIAVWCCPIVRHMQAWKDMWRNQ